MMRRNRANIVSNFTNYLDEDIIRKKAEIYGDGKLNNYSAFKNIEDLFKGLSSYDSDIQLKALKILKRLLRDGSNIQVKNTIVEAKFSKPLVELLAADESPHVQLQAAWVITNLASGKAEHTRAVVKLGGIEKLIKLVDLGNTELKKQAVWALGNMAADNVSCRDKIVEGGLVTILVRESFRERPSTQLLKLVSWAASIICHSNYPTLPSKIIHELLQSVPMFLKHPNLSTISNGCWCCSYITDKLNRSILKLISPILIKKLVVLLEHENLKVVNPALQAVGNILAYGGSPSDIILAYGVMDKLKTILKMNNPHVTKYSLWCIGNLLIGDQLRINEFMKTDLIVTIIECAKKGPIECQIEAVHALFNFCACGTQPQIEYVVRKDILSMLFKLFAARENHLILMALKTLELILKAAADVNKLEKIIYLIGSIDGVEQLEELQNHSNLKIYHKAFDIVAKYFNKV